MELGLKTFSKTWTSNSTPLDSQFDDDSIKAAVMPARPLPMTATLTVRLVLAIQTSGLGASAPLLFRRWGGCWGWCVMPTFIQFYVFALTNVEFISLCNRDQMIPNLEAVICWRM